MRLISAPVSLSDALYMILVAQVDFCVAHVVQSPKLFHPGCCAAFSPHKRLRESISGSARGLLSRLVSCSMPSLWYNFWLRWSLQTKSSTPHRNPLPICWCRVNPSRQFEARPCLISGFRCSRCVHFVWVRPNPDRLSRLDTTWSGHAGCGSWHGRCGFKWVGSAFYLSNYSTYLERD